MRGDTVTQRVNRDFLFEPELFHDEFHTALHRRRIHRLRSAGGRFPVSPDGWEKQRRMTMRCPILAQDRQRTLGQGQVAILGTLPTMNVDHHPLGIEITGLQIQSFLQSQAQRIDGPQVSQIGRAS